MSHDFFTSKSFWSLSWVTDFFWQNLTSYQTCYYVVHEHTKHGRVWKILLVMTFVNVCKAFPSKYSGVQIYDGCLSCRLTRHISGPDIYVKSGGGGSQGQGKLLFCKAETGVWCRSIKKKKTCLICIKNVSLWKFFQEFGKLVHQPVFCSCFISRAFFLREPA